MKKLLSLLSTTLLAACAIAPESGALSSATPVTTPAPTAVTTSAPSPSPTPARTVRTLSEVGGHAVVSPDGKWIAAPEPPPAGKVPYTPAALIFDLSGKRVAKIEAPGGAWRWMPDSSGLFVAMDAPQRAPALGVATLDSTAARPTGLQLLDATTSRDGKWLLSAVHEGCCIDPPKKAIWIAPRAGGDAKLFVRTITNENAPIDLLGTDPEDRAVYRDGDKVFRQPLTGGTPETIGTISGDSKRLLPGSASPDGAVMVLRHYEPLTWIFVTKDAVTTFDASAGDIVQDFRGERLVFSPDPLWIGPHDVLISGSFGLVRYDVLTKTRAPLNGRLLSGDIALGYGQGRLLVARGRQAVFIDLATARESDAGVELGSDGATGSRGFALADGAFIVSTPAATYRID